MSLNYGTTDPILEGVSTNWVYNLLDPHAVIIVNRVALLDVS